jgi:hypothetical protein
LGRIECDTATDRKCLENLVRAEIPVTVEAGGVHERKLREKIEERREKSALSS